MKNLELTKKHLWLMHEKEKQVKNESERSVLKMAQLTFNDLMESYNRIDKFERNELLDLHDKIILHGYSYYESMQDSWLEISKSIQYLRREILK